MVASTDKAYGDQDDAALQGRSTPAGPAPVRRVEERTDLIADAYADQLRPAGRDHALRQLLRRRRPELEPDRPRHDPLGPPRRAPVIRSDGPSSATSSTSRTPPAAYLALGAAHRCPARAARGVQLLPRRSGRRCSSSSTHLRAVGQERPRADVRNEARTRSPPSSSTREGPRAARLGPALARRGLQRTIAWYREFLSHDSGERRVMTRPRSCGRRSSTSSASTTPQRSPRRLRPRRDARAGVRQGLRRRRSCRIWSTPRSISG